MLFLPGWLGKLMKDIPLVVIQLFSSLLSNPNSFFPTISAYAASINSPKNWLSKIQNSVSVGLERFIETIYQPFLQKCLEWRYLTLSLFMGLFVNNFRLDHRWACPEHKGRLPPSLPTIFQLSLQCRMGYPLKRQKKH